METMWRKKRAQSGMSRADMAKELGVEYNKYRAMERGEIQMPSKLMDKFNEIINRGQHVNKLEQLDNQTNIDTFWNDVTVKENGQYKLMNKMKDFNIDTYKELAQLLGYKDGTIFSTRLAHPEEAPIEFKTKVYNFFQDELNRQLPKVKEKKKKNNKAKKKIEEVKHIMENISEISTVINEEEMILPISSEPIVEQFAPLTKEPVDLITKYKVKIDDIDKELAILSVKTLELSSRKTIYEEVLNDLLNRGE